MVGVPVAARKVRTVSERSLETLGQHFEELSALLHIAGTEGPSADRVVKVARAALGAEHAGLTLLREKQRPRSVAATDPVVLEVDELQYELREGPCLEAAACDDVVRADDLAEEARWGAFGPECAARTQIHSMLGVRLGLVRGDRAAMNFYSQSPKAFDEHDEDVATLFAPFVAMALGHDLEARRTQELSEALSTSRQIGVAIGIVMAQEIVTQDEAFARLVKASQQLNRKLRVVAEQVMETGEVPDA